MGRSVVGYRRHVADDADNDKHSRIDGGGDRADEKGGHPSFDGRDEDRCVKGACGTSERIIDGRTKTACWECGLGSR